jgi:uncharacterized membrane protein
MMQKIIYIHRLFFLIMLLSCIDESKTQFNETIHIDTNTLIDKKDNDKQNKDSVYFNQFEIDSISLNIDCNEKIKSIRNLIVNYNTNMGDPDTSLCIFLYLDCDKNTSYKTNFVEYFRLYSEYNKAMTLFQDLFSCMSDFNKKRELLTKRRVEILLFSRNEVENDFEIYGSVDSPYFEFLKEIKDKVYFKYEKKF